MKLYKPLLLLFLSPFLRAQVTNPSIVSVSSAPSGACTSGLPNQQVITTGTQYSCQSGTWGAIAGSGGSGTVTSVGVTTANGVSATGGPITTSGNFSFSLGAITPTSTNGVSAATMAFNDATSSIQTQLN